MKVRTRFAPSPTGVLHVGGLRTALYNYLFAKQNNGKFILRIEDTDQKRFIKNATNNLQHTLKTYGLRYDEGPDKKGLAGPYVQSKRLHVYKKYYLKLIKDGAAYVCFQNELPSDQLVPEWNPEIALKRITNEPFVVKLKIHKNDTLIVCDEIRGKISFDLNLIDDFIIIKTDGYPTYHFANVVDDHLMNISHVIRGEEWLPSLPKHVLLYKYLNWDTPKFCHLPLLLNSDKSKLSKRQGDVSAEKFLINGYIKEAVINFIALLGWHPKNNQEIFSLKELIKSFSINMINKSGAVFDIEKLNWMNGFYIKNMPLDNLALYFKKELRKSNIDISNLKKFLRFTKFSQNRIDKITEIINEANLFYQPITINLKELEHYQYENIFGLWKHELCQIKSLDKESINFIIKKTKNKLDIYGKNMFLPLRLALIGTPSGPDIFSIIYVLGITESATRLERWIQ